MAALQESVGLPKLRCFIETLNFIPYTCMFRLMLEDLVEIARSRLKFNADLFTVLLMSFKGRVVVGLPA